MVPTGSIFGRSWRTRWSTRLRLVALGVAAGLVMLVAAHAHADWRTNVPLGTPGTPDRYVEVWSPRNFAVGTSNGAVLFLDGGYSRKISHTGYFSAGATYESASDCFISIASSGDRGGVRSDGNLCLSFLPVIDTSQNAASVMRVRPAGDGGFIAVTGESSTSEGYFAAVGTSSFTPVFAAEENFNGSVGVVRMGGSFYAAAGARHPNAVLHWFTNPENDLDWNRVTLDAGMVRAIEMFSPDGVTPYAVVGTETGFLHSTLRDNKQPILSPGQWLDAGIGVPSLSLNVEAGGANGRGFGMAITSLPDGGQAMAGAVPMLDARQAGTHWVFRPLPSAEGASLRHVSCSGASYCVVAAERADAGTLFIYTNTAGPTVVPDPSIPDGSVRLELEEGKPRQFTFGATDPDQDPVLVSASVGLPGSWSLEQVDAGVDGGWQPGDPLAVTLSGGSVCSSGVVGRLDVRASDGRASHDTVKFLDVYVAHTRPPQVPPVSRSKLQLVAGEADPLRFEVGAPVGGCALTGYQWSQVPGPVGLPAPTLTQIGSAAVLTAPPNLCVEGGALFTYQLVVKDEAGLESQPPASFDVRVAPWGRPRQSFTSPAPVVLAAGQSRDLLPEQSLHACENAAGFPGVETTWLLDGTLVEGITVRDVERDAGVSQFPVRTGAAGLRLETRECLATTTPLKFTAVNRTATTGGLSSEPSSREVVVEATQLTPLEQGTLGLQRESLSPEGVLTVRLASDLNCVELRPELFADLQMGRADGSGSVLRERVRVPSSWNVNLDPSCQGGRFRVTGALVGGPGTSPVASSLEVDLPPVPPGLEELPPTTLVASCGAGARTSLTQTFPAGTCQTPNVTWKRMFGPLLTLDPQEGNSVELATRDTGLDTLVGESLVVKVTASVGGGNEVSRVYSLPITVEPFVRVRRRTEVPAASETGFVGVSVELRNTSACGVSGVSYVERMMGLTYVEGSAQFDGQPVAATWADGALTVTGLGLGAEGSGRLTYVARPHLVGERRMEGEARLKGELISIREASGPSVPVSGCGCTSSGSGPVLLALGALGWALRRRRR